MMKKAHHLCRCGARLTAAHRTDHPAAQAVVRVSELIAVVRAYAAALDLSDSDHEDFADSCADVVDHLWMDQSARDLVRRLDDGAVVEGQP